MFFLLTDSILKIKNYGDLMLLDSEIQKYLKMNHIKVYIEKDYEFLDLSIIDDDLKGKEIFLTGENHGVKANEKLRIKFLKYFKEKTDFKYYLCELPYSISYFLNIYLETGDIEILKEIYKPLKGTDAWNRDDFNHWIKLYEFNRSLPKNRRIKVIGVDIEHQPENAFRFMKYILPKGDIPMEIRKMIGEIKSILNNDINISDNNIEEFSLKLNRDLEDKEYTYRKYLGKDYFRFKFVNKNLLHRHKVYHGNNFNGIRDKKIYKNFLEIEKRLPKGKYYGQWGLSHIFQKPFPYVNWLGARLNGQGSIFKGKVLSIAYVYDNCKYLYPTSTKNYISSINTLDLKVKAFSSFIKSGCTLFKLNGKNSPFSKKLIWPIIHKFPKDGVTTDYFQYLMVIKDSDAVEPFT